MTEEPPSLADTLVAFAGLDEAGLMRLDGGELESRLQLAALVWNAVLLANEEAAEAHAGGGDGDAAFEGVVDGLIVEIEAGLGGASEELELAVRHLVVRKLERWDRDQRAIGHVSLVEQRGRVRVMATPA